MLSQPAGLITPLLFCHVGVFCSDGVTSCRRVWSYTLSRGAFRDLKFIFNLGRSCVTMVEYIESLVSFHLSISLLWIVLWSYFIISRAPDKVSSSPHSSLSLPQSMSLFRKSRWDLLKGVTLYFFPLQRYWEQKLWRIFFFSKILFKFPLRSSRKTKKQTKNTWFEPLVPSDWSASF